MKAKAYYFASFCYSKRADWWKVIEILTRAIEHDPKLFQAYEQRSEAYETMRRPDEAKADKDQAELIKRGLIWEAARAGQSQ